MARTSMWDDLFNNSDMLHPHHFPPKVRKLLWDKVYARCSRKLGKDGLPLKGKELKDCVSSNLYAAAWEFQTGVEVSPLHKRESDKSAETQVTDILKELERKDKKPIRIGRPSGRTPNMQIWGNRDEATEEDLIDKELEIWEKNTERYMSGCCKRCSCSPCICREED